MKPLYRKILQYCLALVLILVIASLALIRHLGIWNIVFPSHKHETVAPEIPLTIEQPAILLFTKTNTGGTDLVWFYDLQADGYSLDDKRNPLLGADSLGALADEPLTEEEHEQNNLPDVLARWRERDGSEKERPSTQQSFCVTKADIAANDYDLSINRYKEIVYDEAEYPPPAEILAELAVLEDEIAVGLNELGALLT